MSSLGYQFDISQLASFQVYDEQDVVIDYTIDIDEVYDERDTTLCDFRNESEIEAKLHDLFLFEFPLSYDRSVGHYVVLYELEEDDFQGHTIDLQLLSEFEQQCKQCDIKGTFIFFRHDLA